MSIHLILTITLCGRCYHYPHFTDEGTEAQGLVPGSQCWTMWNCQSSTSPDIQKWQFGIVQLRKWWYEDSKPSVLISTHISSPSSYQPLSKFFKSFLLTFTCQQWRKMNYGVLFGRGKLPGVEIVPASDTTWQRALIPGQPYLCHSPLHWPT